jgi:hypothetical protein
MNHEAEISPDPKLPRYISPDETFTVHFTGGHKRTFTVADRNGCLLQPGETVLSDDGDFAVSWIDGAFVVNVAPGRCVRGSA